MEPYNPATRTITADRSPATAAVDNLLRRALRIRDPGNVDEVVRGLLARYPDDAAKIKREQMGVPFSVMPAQPVAVAPARAGRPEATASDALERALTELTTSPELADVAPEMRGWAATIRRAAADGLSSAPYAIDASERDRAFAARRTLGDYARLARYTAAVNACAKDIYCRVAQACDRVGNIILVLIGDGLDDAGVTRSGTVIQVTAATLQSRRDALIVALRNLLQLVPTSDQETWPRGTVALADIYRVLEQAGAADLRALLDEAYLSRQLDDLVDLATGSTPDGLRALGATSAVTVQKLRRLFVLANGVAPFSPPAVNFFAELQLFIDSFRDSTTGYRLPFLARSPLLVSGNRTTGQADGPTDILLRLALQRTALADAIDCLCCTCDPQATRDLVVAGLVLFNIDRAIDLYALGTARNGLGDAEWRAAAYGALALACFRPNVVPWPPGVPVPPAPAVPPHQLPVMLNNVAMFSRFVRLAETLRWVRITPPAILNPDITTTAPAAMRMRRSRQLAAVVNAMIEEERRWAELVSTIAPRCRQDLLFPGRIPGTQPSAIPINPIGRLLQVTTLEIMRLMQPAAQWPGFIVPQPVPRVRMPAPVAISSNILATQQPFFP